MNKLFFILSLISLLPFLAATKTLAVNTVEKVVQSEVGDNVIEIDKRYFYAYGSNTGNGGLDFTPTYGGSGNGCTGAGCAIPNEAAPDWTTGALNSINNVSWSQARDASESNPDQFNRWWCTPLTNINCHPWGTGASDPKQITGPSGFIDGETLLFRKSFTLSPPAGYKTQKIEIYLWSDNNSWAYIDGQIIGTAGLNNPQAYESANVNPNAPTYFSLSAQSLGINSTQTVTKKLAIQVSNDYPKESTNPIGVSYKIIATYEPIMPTASISMTGPVSCSGGSACTTPSESGYTFSATASTVANNLNRMVIYVTKRDDSSDWSGICPGPKSGRWCTLKDVTINPVKGSNTIDNNLTPWTPPENTSYYVVVNAHTTLTDAWCSGNPFGGAPDCGPFDFLDLTVASPPTISSLQVSNSSSTQTGGFTGGSRISGLQGSEGGSNWLNPMNITLNAVVGSSPIKQYYVAFYDKSVGTAYSSIISNPATSEPNINLKNLLIADPAAGFLLAYDVAGSKHYIWDPTSTNTNKWVDITGLTNGWPICGFTAGVKDCDNKPYYTVFSGNTLGNPPNPTLPHSWDIWLYKNFGGKTMYTAGFVTDSNNLPAYQADINP